jgi:deoxyribonuclease-4
MLIGAHESVAGGVDRAWGRAVEDGCEAMQVWVRSSRAWKSPPLKEETVRAWNAARREARGVRLAVAHSSYLINPGTANPELRDKSLATLTDELERCERLGINSLVLHPGSHGGDGEEVGLDRVAATLDELHRRLPGITARICLENTAGQGTGLGWRWSHFAGLLDRVAAPERLGVCVDTQHAFASGHDLRSDEGWRATWAAVDEAVGLERVNVIHLNDSRTALGSRVDRHALIGEGELGVGVFERLVNDARFEATPGLLETPAKDKVKPYAVEIAMLQGLRR